MDSPTPPLHCRSMYNCSYVVAICQREAAICRREVALYQAVCRYLIVDPPRDDGGAMEVDGAGGVVAPVHGDHGHVRRHEAVPLLSPFTSTHTYTLTQGMVILFYSYCILRDCFSPVSVNSHCRAWHLAARQGKLPDSDIRALGGGGERVGKGGIQTISCQSLFAGVKLFILSL